MKNHKLLIYLFICFIYSCKTDSKRSITSNKTDIVTKSYNVKKDTLPEEEIKLEYLQESILINNKYTFEGKIKDLKLLINKTDSIYNQEDDCGYVLEDSYAIWYYSNCEIEVSKTEYAFRKINFTSSEFILKYNDVVFSKNYTIGNFKKDFPISFSKNKNYDQDGTIIISVLIHPMSDDMYIFKFKNNKLFELIYFIPC